MTLRELLAKKSDFVEQQAKAIERLFAELPESEVRKIIQALALVNYDYAAAIQILEQLGFTEAVIQALQGYSQVLDFSREISKKLGVPFVLTPNGEMRLVNLIDKWQDMVENRFKADLAADMLRFAISGGINQTPQAQIVKEFKELLGTTGRRVSTEVATAIATFDRATALEVFDAAGIERFTYFPPTTIATTRPACAAVVEGEKNLTEGYTRAEIEALDGVDFVTGGGYNCRHEWLPFIKGVTA